MLNAEVCFCEQGREGVAGGFDVFTCAFFSVDGADDFDDFGALGFDDFGGFEDLPAGGADIFDEEDLVTFTEFAFELLGGPVIFFLVPNEDAGFA